MVYKRIIGVLVLMLFVWGCVTTGQTPTESAKPSKEAATKTQVKKVKKVALVSLIVRNYGIYGNMGMIPSDLINDNMINVLSLTESTIGEYWKVKPIKTFINNKSYRSFNTGSASSNYHTATVSGKQMPIFFNTGKDFIKGNISKETAQKLCKHLAVDAIALVYSEWYIQTGKFVPTTKALTKNCISMYDKNGKYLFFGRKDVLGSATVGSAFSGVHINEETIVHWLEAYETGIQKVFASKHRKLK